MMIKLACWDLYGTIIASGRDEVSDCQDSEPLRLRKEVRRALDYIRDINVFQITYSDGDLGNQKRNLENVGIDWKDCFFDLYQFRWNEPKDPQVILDIFGLNPSEVVVFGDNWKIDIFPAIQKGCHVIYVPETEEDYSIYDRLIESGIFSRH